MQYAQISGSSFYLAKADNADFYGATIQGCVLDSADFKYTNLTRVSISSSSAKALKLRGFRQGTAPPPPIEVNK